MAESPEQKYYNHVYQKTDSSSSGKIEGRQAVALFRTSGVAVQTLKTIWELATPNKEDYLDKNRFFIALKLIALAQEGRPVNLQMLHEKVGLPKFEGIELPELPDEWEVGEKESEVYLSGFKKLSGDKGFLTPAESKELLQRTQFSPDVLRKIWNAVGLGNGNMNSEQFMVSMQLIAKARGGIEIPEKLPASLERILNKKPKEVSKNPEIRVKDPEPKMDTPKPISQSTLGDDFESPKKASTVIVKINTEKFIKEKEKIFKEKTNMLKSICELMEVDETELELVKEKNKILEEKLRESNEAFEKMKKKIVKAKDKFELAVGETHGQVEKLQKENTELKKKLSEAAHRHVDPPVFKPVETPVLKHVDPPAFKAEPAEKPQPIPVKVPERQSDENKIPKKDIGFEFDSFFKDPLPSSSKPAETKKVVETHPVTPPNDFFSQKIDPKPESSLFPQDEKPKPKTENSLFPSEVSASMKFDNFPQVKPRSDDIFASLDPAPPAHVGKMKKDSSSSEDEPKPKAEFGFRFSEDFEKKIEKPIEFKPEPASFNAGFGDFSKAFNFAGGMPSFDDNFFKMDTKPVQSKGKTKDIEFE